MATYRGPKCRLCRREGEKLFLKGTRCETVKCAIAKRAYPPGMHPFRRRRLSEYGLQFREKQKAKRAYGVQERQFMTVYVNAQKMGGNTGANMLQLLERRLDNVIFLMGFATSRQQGKQMIAHGHVEVDGRKVDVPSFVVKQGQKIGIKQREASRKLAAQNFELVRSRGVPSWVSRDEKTFTGDIIDLPKRDEVSVPLNDQLIVELCAK